MEEVRPNNLEVGKDYYIEMVGSQVTNEYRESGKAIGRGFIRTITLQEILNEDREYSGDYGINPEAFDMDHIFVQFREVVPVNPGRRACGICDFQFYPVPHPDYYTLNEEQKKRSSGGYIFFNINKKALIKRVQDQAMAAWRPDLPDVEEGAGPKSHVASFIGGKKRRRKRRRKSRRKTRRKTRKTKRKSRKRRRKRKTKRRR